MVEIWTLKSFLPIEQHHPLDVTMPCDSYAWNSRKPMKLLTLRESLAEGGFKPLTIG